MTATDVDALPVVPAPPLPVPTATPQAPITDWKGEYFDNRELRGDPVVVDTDEHPRYRKENGHYELNTSMEQLAKLRPAFRKGGTVTAGNSSGINDGAAAVVVMRSDEALARGLTPLARIASWATVGVDPAVMGSGPIPASRAALEKAGWTVEDLDLVEANEAFAAQYIGCERELGLDRDITNVNGSGIGLGHPVGATGARIIVTLIHALKQREKSLGLATLCGGGGVAMACAIELL